MSKRPTADKTPRKCEICGDMYVPKYSKQRACNAMKVKPCPICGKPYTYKCTAKQIKQACSIECTNRLIKEKREASAALTTKICAWCGKEFHPRYVRQKYCDDTHYGKCVICGKEYEVHRFKKDTRRTCSNECEQVLISQNKDITHMTERLKQTMLERYGVDNAAKLPGSISKAKQTALERYGVEYYTQTEEYKERVKATCLEKYGVEHHLSSQSVRDKRKQTCLERYGSENVFGSDYGKAQTKRTLKQRYGIANPSQFKAFKDKATKNSRQSTLERRICQLFDNYGITYIHHYFLKNNGYSHEFDFYLPEYKLLIDADGLYYHSYLSDPDGVRVRDDYDEVRLYLVPEDHIFELIVEYSEDKQVKAIVNLLESIKSDFVNYDSYLFQWCRSIDFPYPNYKEKRLAKDWGSLNKYKSDIYNPLCRIGGSLIKQFHKSIYSCHVGKLSSPYEGWYDDDKLKRVIKNRCIYKNDVDPSKILAGFNISKICPCVSIFNPVLTKYLIQRYLAEYNTVFDPFSGFSGRMLGTITSDKYYIGQDLNSKVIAESRDMLNYLGITDGVSLEVADILESNGMYECLLTCPPYGDKEIYADETVFKSCDEWIDECLNRFDCKRYVFVVDKTDKYTEYVTETLQSSSHFATIEELVIVIDKKAML